MDEHMNEWMLTAYLAFRMRDTAITEKQIVRWTKANFLSFFFLSNFDNHRLRNE